MESNITLYYFIFNKPFSATNKHKYTHNGSNNQSFLYNTNRFKMFEQSEHDRRYTVVHCTVVSGWCFVTS